MGLAGVLVLGGVAAPSMTASAAKKNDKKITSTKSDWKKASNKEANKPGYHEAYDEITFTLNKKGKPVAKVIHHPAYQVVNVGPEKSAKKANKKKNISQDVIDIVPDEVQEIFIR